jgi:hypothetical protein
MNPSLKIILSLCMSVLYFEVRASGQIDKDWARSENIRRFPIELQNTFWHLVDLSQKALAGLNFDIVQQKDVVVLNPEQISQMSAIIASNPEFLDLVPKQNKVAIGIILGRNFNELFSAAEFEELVQLDVWRDDPIARATIKKMMQYGYFGFNSKFKYPKDALDILLEYDYLHILLDHMNTPEFRQLCPSLTFEYLADAILKKLDSASLDRLIRKLLQRGKSLQTDRYYRFLDALKKQRDVLYPAPVVPSHDVATELRELKLREKIKADDFAHLIKVGNSATVSSLDQAILQNVMNRYPGKGAPDIFALLPTALKILIHKHMAQGKENGINNFYSPAQFENLVQLAAVRGALEDRTNVSNLLIFGYDLFRQDEQTHTDGLDILLNYGLVGILLDNINWGYPGVFAGREIEVAEEIFKRLDLISLNNLIAILKEQPKYEQILKILEKMRSEVYPEHINSESANLHVEQMKEIKKEVKKKRDDLQALLDFARSDLPLNRAQEAQLQDLIKNNRGMFESLPLNFKIRLQTHLNYNLHEIYPPKIFAQLLTLAQGSLGFTWPDIRFLWDHGYNLFIKDPDAGIDGLDALLNYNYLKPVVQHIANKGFIDFRGRPLTWYDLVRELVQRTPTHKALGELLNSFQQSIGPVSRNERARYQPFVDLLEKEIQKKPKISSNATEFVPKAAVASRSSVRVQTPAPID